MFVSNIAIFVLKRDVNSNQPNQSLYVTWLGSPAVDQESMRPWVILSAQVVPSCSPLGTWPVLK